MTSTPPRSAPDGAPDPELTLAAELGALLGDDAAAESTVNEVRAAILAPIDDAVASSHLAAMFAAADGIVDDIDGSHEGEPTAVVDLSTRRRSKRVAIAGIVAVAATTLTGGLAAANTLPAPLQDAVARVGEVFSIPVPTVADRVDGEGDVGGDDLPATSTSTTTSLPGDTTTTMRPGPPPSTPGSTAPGSTGETPGQSGDVPPSSGNAPPPHLGQTGPPPHAGQNGPPPHAGQTGPPPHANNGNGNGPPPHAGQTGPPPHAGNNGNGPPPHAGQTGPPPHANNGNGNGNGNGPPPHAGQNGPPPHAGQTGPPPHANNNGNGPTPHAGNNGNGRPGR